MLRYRKKEGSVSVNSAGDTLLHELRQSWEEAKEGGLTVKEYECNLDKAAERILDIKKNSNVVRGQRCTPCRTFLCLFDCVWTVLLLVVLLIAVIAYFDLIDTFLQANLHTRIYHVNRALRHGYLAAHPYLQAVGLEATKDCLVQNPFVNKSMRCPCLENKVPVVVELPVKDLPISRVLSDYSSVYVIRGGVETGGVAYGRDTIVQYFREHGFGPHICTQFRHHQQGPMITDLVDDSLWPKFAHSDFPWDLTWHECKDAEIPFWSLLPFTFDKFRVPPEKNVSYCLARQWGTTAFMREEKLNRMVLAVLSGKMRVAVECATHCIPHCPQIQGKVVLEAGDVLVFDSRYWSYSQFTWSDFSFTMTTSYSSYSS